MNDPEKKKSEEVGNNTTEKTKGNEENVEETTVENIASSDSLKENQKVEVIEVKENNIKVEKPSNSLANITPTELSTLDYNDFSTPARMLALGEVLVKGKMCPLKQPADVVIALLTGKELGLPFISSLSEIYPINGKPTLGVHIMKAIALKNGIIYSKTRDFEDKYMFVKVDKDGNPMMENKKPVIVKNGFLDEQPEGTKKSKIDTVTEYKLTREIKTPSGKYKEVTVRGSFSILEAQQAELLIKDNWQKYPKRMLEARAFSVAIKEIADDLLHGIMTPDELS